MAAARLELATSALLHASGWRARLAYHRRLAGEALTLPMLLMRLDLDPPETDARIDSARRPRSTVRRAKYPHECVQQRMRYR